jgi:hypothetical protein
MNVIVIVIVVTLMIIYVLSAQSPAKKKDMIELKKSANKAADKLAKDEDSKN